MLLEENKIIVRRMFEAINNHDLGLLDDLMIPNFVMHMNDQESRGWKVSRKFLEDEMKAFPDLHVTIEDVVAEGDRVCVRLLEMATHLGEYRGMSPTGNKLSYIVVAIWRVMEGKIVEGWVVYDQLNFLEQLESQKPLIAEK
jgi:predicted ester cyclase